MPLVSLLFGNNCTRGAPPKCHAHLRAVPREGIAVSGIAPRRVTVISAELVPISQCQQNPYRALTGGRGAQKTKKAITRPKAKRRHKRIQGGKHSAGAKQSRLSRFAVSPLGERRAQCFSLSFADVASVAANSERAPEWRLRHLPSPSNGAVGVLPRDPTRRK